MPKHKAKNLVVMCNTEIFHASKFKRHICNTFKTILRNTTVHDAFYMALFDGLFQFKSPLNILG